MVCSKALAPSRVLARALLQALNYNYSTGHDITQHFRYINPYNSSSRRCAKALQISLSALKRNYKLRLFYNYYNPLYT